MPLTVTSIGITLDKVDITYFLNLNCISCMWVGPRYADLGKYGKEIDAKFPDMRHVNPYREPLFAIVTIDEKGAEIKGCKSDYVGKTPEELGLYNPDSNFVRNGIRVTAEIKNRYLPF